MDRVSSPDVGFNELPFKMSPNTLNLRGEFELKGIYWTYTSLKQDIVLSILLKFEYGAKRGGLVG